jgi:cytochrome c biogenesis protein CcdA
MVAIGQPPVLVAGFAAGVLMFFSPCGVGLLPAYLTYFSSEHQATASEGRAHTGGRSSFLMARIGSAVGAVVFLAGAIPLFYMAVAGIRIRLPGYQFIVPLAKLGTASYIPPVVVVVVGTVLLLNSAVVTGGFQGLYVGVVATAGITSTYVVVGAPVVLLGQWVRPYLTPLELLAGPLIVAIGLMYYRNITLPSIALPARRGRSTDRFFTFGVLYGIGSLACNLPVFLGIVLSVFVTDGVIDGLGVFIAFAGGMSTLMVGISVLTATTEGSISVGDYGNKLRPVGSAAFVLIGLYVTWFTLRSFGYL